MKLKLSILALSLSVVTTMMAQKDTKARDLLEKTETAYLSSNGVKVSFKGSASGTICLMEDKFYLSNDHMESWFDGTTQWSYVKQNEEVNISEPTEEELQSINPYALLSLYKQGFNYKYVGTTSFKGQSGEEVVLMPEGDSDLKEIRIIVNKRNQPFYICLKTTTGESTEFIVTGYADKQNFTAKDFTFQKAKYPHAEVIDLR